MQFLRKTRIASIFLLFVATFATAREAIIEATLEINTASIPSLIGEWHLTPQYRLPESFDPASTGMVKPPVTSLWGVVPPPERSFRGDETTDRFLPELDRSVMPQGEFSIELWVSYHVNQVVGAFVRAEADSSTQWFFGFHKGEVYFGLEEEVLKVPAMEIKGDVPYDFDKERYQQGMHRYWHHLVGTFDGALMKVYWNGELLEESRHSIGRLNSPAHATLVIDGYFEREPFMRLGNLVKVAALYGQALENSQIRELFVARGELIEKGILYRDRLHFTTTAPHVAFPRPDGVSLLWETDRPAAAHVFWGETRDLGNRIDVPEQGSRRHQLSLSGLRPDTGYYYRVVAASGEGQRVDSGLNAFRTAIAPGSPVVFAAISDPEARPHINARLASLLWSESPQLVLNVGDLSDGGRLPNRVEWTHEYLAAMAHLMARVPFVPVMGNGEDDFVWFERYHALPEGARSYYNYRFGDVEFFVLDSNLARRQRADPEFRPRQREWFAKVLRSSTARWKVVAFHHPPFSGDDSPVRQDFVDLIDAHEVDLVLLGHHHHYLRSWPVLGASEVAGHGPIYIQLGGGGGNPSGPASTHNTLWAKNFQGFGYSVFRVHGDMMECCMHDAEGAMRDRFVLEKNPGPGRWASLR
jgi:acid phosphatase type 7